MKCKNLFSSQSRISERRFGGQETLNHQSEGLPLILRVRICAFRKYFDVSITVPIVIMFLHGCERILHKQQLYIFGLLSGDCSNDSSLRETGFLQTALDPSSVRVNFSNLEEYGDFPPTHGDIPMVFDRLYELRQVFSSTFNTRSFSFLTYGSILLFTSSMEDTGDFTCTDFVSGFSFNAKHIQFEVSKVQFIQFLFLAIPRLQFHQWQYKDLYPIQLTCNFNWLNGKLWKRS